MAAGLGFKTFTTGEVLTAADTNGYLMQGVLVFASAAARDAAITSPQEGQCCYLKDTDAVLTYSGAAWVGFDDSNAIQNTIVDAKGDLIAATAADTPARLAVGTNYNVLSAQSAETTGLLWAGAPTSFTPTWTMDAGTPAIGNGNMTMTYIRYGKFCNIQFLFQAGSTTTFGTSGNFYFTLPFTAQTSGLNAAISGGFYAEDYAVAGYSGLTGVSGDGTKMFLKIPQSANASWGKTTPFTWATNDFFNGTFSYEVA